MAAHKRFFDWQTARSLVQEPGLRLVEAGTSIAEFLTEPDVRRTDQAHRGTARGMSWVSACHRGDRSTILSCLALTLLMAASDAAAQTGAPRLVIGPVFLHPTIVLRDVGVDSNIGNDPVNPREDFTLTVEPGVHAAAPFGVTRVTGSAAIGFVHYATYEDLRSVNRRFEGRFEGTSGLLRPFVAASLNHARARPQFEIDARILTHATALSFGGDLKLTPLTSLTASYRRENTNYGDEERFLGTALADQLDHITGAFITSARWAITPLTTTSLDVEWQRDRFDRYPLRNADSVRVEPTVEFAPGAAITGKASLGFRHFAPLDPRVKVFNGLVGSASLSGTVLGVTRISVDAVRDVMHSFDPLTPNYVVTSGYINVSQWIGGPFDVIGVFGGDRLHYSVIQGVPLSGRTDRTRRAGGGVGFRVNPSLRLTVIYDDTRRRSDSTERRDYNRRRLFGSVTYEL